MNGGLGIVAFEDGIAGHKDIGTGLCAVTEMTIEPEMILDSVLIPNCSKPYPVRS